MREWQKLNKFPVKIPGGGETMNPLCIIVSPSKSQNKVTPAGMAFLAVQNITSLSPE